VGLAAALVATALGICFAQVRLGGPETVIRSILPGPAGSLGRGTIATPALQPGGAPGRQVALPFPSGSARQPLSGLQAMSSAGYLQLPSRRLDLGAASSGSLVITASDGPVAWSANTSSPDLVLSSRHGWLAKGGKFTLILSRARDSRRSSQAKVTIGPGNLSVLVSWISPSLSPSPSPSPGPSVRPSRRPSPRRPGTRPSELSPGPSAVRAKASSAVPSPVPAPESGPLPQRAETRQQAQPPPRQPDQPGPGQQDHWRPWQQDRWSPWQPDRRGPWQWDQWSPWQQDEPGPWQQDEPGLWQQDEPGPWQQDEPGPWQQDQPGP